MIDLHSHVLPGVDDGAPDDDAALALARAALSAGIETIAATPHIDHHHGVDPLEIPERVERLNGVLADAGLPVSVVQGGELGLDRWPELDDDELDAITLGGGGWILLECPIGHSPFELEDAVRDLYNRGFDVLLGHPERAPIFQREPEALGELVWIGAHCQVTAGALGGDYGRRPRDLAFELLRRGWIHVVASDSHDPLRRPPDLLGGIARAEAKLEGLEALAPWLTNDVPAAIIGESAVPDPPGPWPRPRSRFRR